MNFIRKSSVARAAALIGRCMPAAGLALGIAIATGASAPAQTAGEAIYAVTYLDVSPDWVVQGTGLLKQYRDISSHQAGNLGFTVLRETARPNRFVIVEGWKDQAAFDAHGKSADAARFDFTLEAIRNSPPNQHVLRAFATAPAKADPATGAVRMVEHVDFSPAAGAAALPELKALAESSQKEAGVVRYDVYQEPAPHSNHYSVVAVWTNKAAFDAHETAAYTRQFRAATLMPARANLYDERLYDVVD
jgi:quinol monooxygenase YgiN